MSMTQILRRQIRFSQRAFGPGDRAKGIVDHIRKELVEVEAAPKDLSEWIDLAMLAFDGAWRAGYTPEDIVTAYQDKITKNEGRTWPDWRTADPDGAIEHDRSADNAKHIPCVWPIGSCPHPKACECAYEAQRQRRGVA